MGEVSKEACEKRCSICWDLVSPGEPVHLSCMMPTVQERAPFPVALPSEIAPFPVALPHEPAPYPVADPVDESNADATYFLSLSLFGTWGEDDEPQPCPLIHRQCLSKHLMMQAENGRIPSTCPSCMRNLSATEVHSILEVDSREQWRLLCDCWEKLRAGALTRPPPELQEVLDMQSIGCVACPRCKAWVQKEEADWIYGCDKMTCRCGARFCFKCGSLNAACDCTGDHHGFIDHELVLSNYAIFDDIGSISEFPDFLRRHSGAFLDSVASLFASDVTEMSQPIVDTSDLVNRETDEADPVLSVASAPIDMVVSEPLAPEKTDASFAPSTPASFL